MFEDPIESYASRGRLDVLENANRYPGPTGFFSYFMERSMKRLRILPSNLLGAHEQGIIYIHKLPYSFYIPYCTGHSISRLLERGLRTPTIAARPAKHLDSFVDHVANYLITLQHYFSGAQAFSAVELYAGPFIREVNDTRHLKQQVQRLVYNLNFPSRVGMQTPFTNFTIVLDAPRKMLEEDLAVYNGRKERSLGTYIEEGKKFVIAFAEILREGDSAGQPFTFPIPTIMATSRVIYEDPEVFEAVFTATSKRGSFYWLNSRVVDPDAAYAMCCRISIDRGELGLAKEFMTNNSMEIIERRRFGGIWAVPDVTGSVGVTTVNLPRIALESGGDDSKFLQKLDRILQLVKLAGDWFRRRYVSLMRRYPFIYSMVKEYLEEFPSTYFNTVGVIGLPEAAAIVEGNPKLWFEGARPDFIRAADWMRSVVDHIVSTARSWMRETGTPWNVEEVPGESAAAKLAIGDLRRYPELLEYMPDPENPIYSTSIAPYYGEISLAQRIEIEERVQKSFTGGVMMHIFLGEETDPESLAKLVRRLTETDLVYWSFTPAVTVCRDCNRSSTGLLASCPYCGSSNVELWSRIIGYYRPLKNWNPSRRREFKTRVHYHNPQLR
ncbi:MAG: anaerobic ribonucleoside triphosphate reductase [Candidatus Korarchaeota archaeon]|nr:anaerobic ribonucleoside triphosphate reductase [Candidatus Korarchaeota archaeon]